LPVFPGDRVMWQDHDGIPLGAAFTFGFPYAPLHRSYHALQKVASPNLHRSLCKSSQCRQRVSILGSDV
jgi:hypothetical protein